MALSHLVVQYESNFCTVALQFMEEEKNYPLPSPATAGTALWRGEPAGPPGEDHSCLPLHPGPSSLPTPSGPCDSCPAKHLAE